MTNSEFSYRPLLQELTDEVNTAGLDPYEAYAWLYEQQAELGLAPDSYLSSSITSGGHARDDSLQMKEIITRNTRSAYYLADQLAADGQIRPKGAIEPVAVGKTAWNQAQFMEFWLSVIGGYQLTKGFVARDINNLRQIAQEEFQANKLDLDLMTSHETAEKRAAEYFKMSTSFADLIKNGAEASPIPTVIRLIDTDMSLGCQAERVFARQIGARVMNILVVRPTGPENLTQVNRILSKDTARLIGFGATIFDTTNDKVRLTLSEEAA
ncbi:MAG: hypothetical protein ACOH18_01005 [Candidatus Saccharimonadaceae bacterium]